MNNVKDPVAAMKAADHLVKKGLATSAIFVPDCLEPVLASFDLVAADLGRGLWYSSAELVGIRLCETRFLVHYASDAALGHQSDWVGRGCRLLSEDLETACVNPVWNGNLREVRSVSVAERRGYSIGRGFSDQCYLIEADRWRKADLTRLHPAADRYPDYAGALFEMRADSWMRFSGLFRATDVGATYLHPVLPGSV